MERLEQVDQLAAPVAVLARQLQELLRTRDENALLWRAHNGDPAPPPELEQTLVAQDAQRAKNGVRVHLQHGRQVARRGKPLAGADLAVGDRATQCRRDLLVQVRRVVGVQLDGDHWC